MVGQLEVRIGTVERIQEEFDHDLREMKGQLIRLTKLIEGYTGIIPINPHHFHSNQLHILLCITHIQFMNLTSQLQTTARQGLIAQIGSIMHLLQQLRQLISQASSSKSNLGEVKN